MGRRSESGGVFEQRGRVRLDFSYQGRRLRPVLNLAWNERNRQAALRLIGEIRGKIKHGTFNPADYFPTYRPGLERLGVARPGAVTFKQMAEAYLATLDGDDYADSTRVSYERILAGHWYAAIGGMDINTIRRADIDAVLIGLAAKTRNNVLIPCRGVFAYADEDGALQRDPTAKIRNAKVQKEEPDPFEPDEVKAILADLHARADPQDADYFQFAFFTGMRASEQIALEWRDYDRARGLVRVRRARVWAKDKKRTKTGVARSVELLGAAQEALQRQRAHTELAGGRIFHNPRTGAPWNDEQVQRKVLDACLRRLGIRHRPPKQTRHTFATMCLMSGANPAWVARQLGHVNTKMLYEVYSKWIDGADKGQERGKVEAWICPLIALKKPRST